MEPDTKTNLSWVYSFSTKNIASVSAARVIILEYAHGLFLIMLGTYHFHPASIILMLFNGFIMEAT
jgi:hypothetical protein